MRDIIIWLYWRCLSFAIVAVIGLAVYDYVAPVYQDVSIQSVRRINDGAGIEGILTFTKVRNCKPIQNTAVAFIEYPGGARTPVDVLNTYNKPIVWKPFPPSEKPVTLRYTWLLPVAAQNPVGISLNFRVTCIFPVSQDQRFEAPVVLPEL